MSPTLIALAGPSRSGKGTCAEVFSHEALVAGLSLCERQLSGPGKQYVASAFRPEITEKEAIAWLEKLKLGPESFVAVGDLSKNEKLYAEVPLQQYLQRMLQGARERWGDDFWTDKLLPLGQHPQTLEPAWRHEFVVDGRRLAKVGLISDLRQVNEAKRVKALGGIVIEMRRPPIENAYVTGSDHITEQRLGALAPELVDLTISNDFTEHTPASLIALQESCETAWQEFVLPKIKREVSA